MSDRSEWLGDTDDPRRRPVVLHTGAADTEPRRRPARYLAWAGTGLLGLVAAAGLVAGGTAVWTAFDPGTPGQSPAPLWFPPPATITPQAEKVTPTPDDHGGDRTRTPDDHAGSRTPDDRGRRSPSGPSATSSTSGTSKGTTEPGDDKGGNRGSSNSGKSPDDKSGHR